MEEGFEVLDAMDFEEQVRKELEVVAQELETAKRKIAAIHNENNSPMYSLPVEIIIQIFLSLHESQPLTRRNVHSKGSKVSRDWSPETTPCLVPSAIEYSTWPRIEVVLSQVCRRWRHIALGLPPLWSVFWTRPETATCRGLINETKRLRTYLRRSKNHHLELYLEFQAPAYLPSDSETRFWRLMKEMLDVTMGPAHRWKCFTLSAVNHDKRMSGLITLPLQERLSRVVAPNLTKFVVRMSPSALTGCRLLPEYGWAAQILYPNPQRRSSLKHVRLDRAGLSWFRPSLRGVAHLVLEYGARDDSIGDPTFQMDWPVFIKEILRSPHLESLSLCDDLLRATTFPGSGWDWAGLHVEMQRVKHLRFGRCLEHSERHNALFFLLRYITAPNLESLTIAGYTMEESPWGLTTGSEWLKGWDEISGVHSLDVFPSLRSLTLIGVSLVSKAPEAVSAAFVRLVNITAFARKLVITHLLQAVLEGLAPYEKLAPGLREFWPQAQEVTLNYAVGYRFNRSGFLKPVLLPWPRLQVLRLPPPQIALWKKKAKMGECWNLRSREEDVIVSGSQFPNGLLVVKPIKEVVPRYWPPDADIAPGNTLEFEGAGRPFDELVGVNLGPEYGNWE